MIRLTAIKIQDNTTLRGAMAQKGLEESELSIPRVLFERESGTSDTGKAIKLPCAIDDKVHAVMKQGLDGIIQQIAEFADANGVDGERIRQSMHANIDSFRLDAGGGYTTQRKAELIEAGQLVAEDFVPPAKAGKASTSGNAVTAEIEL